MNSDMSVARRSSRPQKASKVASYGEEVDVEHPPLRKRVKTTSSKRYNERKPHQVKVATAEQRDSAMKRAKKLESSLPSDHPSFIRSMIKSHVYTCFWLSIPTPFCNNHLPSEDGKIILENEKGEVHDIRFLAKRTGLSGGWRGFALKHKLHDGDAVVFELTKPTRFKVHIIRAHDDLDDDADAMVTESEVQNMEKDADAMVTESEKPLELADPIIEKAAPKSQVDPIIEKAAPKSQVNPIIGKAAPKSQVDGSKKRSRRKLSKPVKSDDGVSSSKIEEDDDLIDDEILNGAVATNNQRGVTSKIKLFRRRSFAKTTLFTMRRTWADECDE